MGTCKLVSIFCQQIHQVSNFLILKGLKILGGEDEQAIIYVPGVWKKIDEFSVRTHNVRTLMYDKI